MSHNRKTNAHAKKRARQRYGLVLNHDDFKRIIILIRESKAEPLKKLSCSRTLYKVSYKEKDLFLIYSKAHKKIITMLPQDAHQLEGTKYESKTTPPTE